MLDVVNQLSNYLDNLIGIKGSLGYICIIVAIMIGHKFVNSSSSPHNNNKNSNNNGVINTGKTTDDSDSDDDEPDPPRNFTLRQLSYFDGQKDKDGEEDKPVYLSLGGTVFDVSGGYSFYGPGGPYELFAGRECGVSLAKMSFDEEYLDDFESLKDLRHGERIELENWVEKFTYYKSYPVLGKVVPTLPESDRILSKEDLAVHKGTEEIPEGYGAPPIYVGAGDKVFDVSFGGVLFYGPGCSYHRFAGVDASRALAKMSFDPADVENNDVSDLTDKQRKTMEDWIKTFHERKNYPIVGRLEK